MSTEEEAKKAAAGSNEGDDSDVELSGMDMEGIDEEGGDDDDYKDDDGDVAMKDSPVQSDEEDVKHAKEDHDEMEEARREQLELMEAERSKVAAPHQGDNASAAEKLEYLLGQSEVFAHFLAGKSLHSSMHRKNTIKRSITM